jgi:uncharacterized membrane protein
MDNIYIFECKVVSAMLRLKRLCVLRNDLGNYEKMFNWLGLISLKPITEDYVSLVPWLEAMWWCMAATQWWLARQGYLKRSNAKPQTTTMATRPLASLGR